MTTEDMIMELNGVREKYKDKPVYTGDVNIPIMCDDIISKLRELTKEIESLKSENRFLKGMLRTNSEFGDKKPEYRDLVNRDPKDPVTNGFPNMQPGTPEPILL